MENNNVTIPYFVHEAELNRQERHIKRLIIALMLAVTMLFVSNLLWLRAWTSYDYTSTVTVDGKDGTANYIGNDGDIHNNGQDYSDQAENQEEPEGSPGN